MNSSLILLFILGYFSLLMLIARITSRRARQNAYFDGDRSSPWFLVAFGMIGSGISAVSLVSIPGNVGNNQLFYFQFILGNIAGYLFIAFVLTPLFHRLKVISIYSYPGQRYSACCSIPVFEKPVPSHPGTYVVTFPNIPLIKPPY